MPPAWASLADHGVLLSQICDKFGLNLNKLGFDCLPSDWPDVSRLMSVCLTGLQAALPDLLSQLQDIKSLTLMYSRGLVLPSCLTLLCSLHEVILKDIQCQLTANITGLAKMPALTALDLGHRGRLSTFRNPSEANELHVLRQLEVAIHEWDSPIRRQHPP